MPAQYASGYENPAVRDMMMSEPQQSSARQPVTDMGLGISSNLQRSASGGNSLATVRKIVKIVLAEKARREEAKKKAKKKSKKEAKPQQEATNLKMTPHAPAVQLPAPVQAKGIR